MLEREFVPQAGPILGSERSARLARTLAALSIVLGTGWSSAAAATDHRPFDALLRQHVVEGFVDYQAFGKAPEFAAYLESLSGVEPAVLPEAERLAFWLNGYNAWTIQLINVAGERESIRNIVGSGATAGKGPWAQPLARLSGKTLSLDEIEHEVLRKQFKEPRIHFALVCAAKGCPPLRAEAYVGERLDKQLDDQARIFLEGSPEKNRVDVATGMVYLSPVFDWFKDDFGGSDAALGRFLAQYQSRPAAKRLLEQGRFQVRFTSYDWSLNDRALLAAAPYQIYERMLLLAEMGETEKLRRAFSLVEPLTREHAAALGRRADDVTALIQSDAASERLRGVRRLVARDVATLLLGVANAPTDRARTLLRSASIQWSLLEASTASGPKFASRLAAAVVAIDANRLAEARASSVGVAREIVSLF